jgi:hypothetical protein
LKKKLFRVHSSPLNPTLKEENKGARVEYCLSFIDPDEPTQYQDMEDSVHLDEKWFYMTTDGERYILLLDEEEPERSVTHKGHIVKVMFLCAMARPRWDTARNAWFDGKIGIWPIGSMVPAQRGSVNRPRYTPEWKNKSIDRAEYRRLMCEVVIPAIKEKMPAAAQANGQESFRGLSQRENQPHLANPAVLHERNH